VLEGELVEGDQVFLGLFEQPAHLWRRRLETLQDVPDPLPRAGLVLSVEHFSKRGGD
jgi:hypothetical protein